MCSNTGSSAGIRGSKVKKPQKCPKVPRRGPGVAELEKILRQQESIPITDKGNTEGFSSSCFIPHHSNPYFSSSQPSGRITVPSPGPTPNNLHSHVPSASIFDHLGPTTPSTMIPSCGNNGTLGRNGGSNLVSSEQELFLFPMNLSSCKSKSNLNEGLDGNQSDSSNSPSRNLSSESNPIWSFPSTIQNRNNQNPPPKMNQFLGVGTTPSSGSLPIVGLQNHLELPSNQSSYHNSIPRAPEEYKMVAMKRSDPSSLDNSLIPPDVPCFSQNKRPLQSSIINSHGVSSFNSSNECYRDAKWGSTSELNSRKCNSEIVVPGHANSPPFATPQVTEDRMEAPCQRSESSGPDSRPFYNFLEVKDTERVTPNNVVREAGKGGIDLTLKL